MKQRRPQFDVLVALSAKTAQTHRGRLQSQFVMESISAAEGRFGHTKPYHCGSICDYWPSKRLKSCGWWFRSCLNSNYSYYNRLKEMD